MDGLKLGLENSLNTVVSDCGSRDGNVGWSVSPSLWRTWKYVQNVTVIHPIAVNLDQRGNPYVPNNHLTSQNFTYSVKYLYVYKSQPWLSSRLTTILIYWPIFTHFVVSNCHQTIDERTGNLIIRKHPKLFFWIIFSKNWFSFCLILNNIYTHTIYMWLTNTSWCYLLGCSSVWNVDHFIHHQVKTLFCPELWFINLI